jgi:hypothetical protein
MNVYSATRKDTLENIQWKIHTNKEKIEVYLPKDYKHPSGLVPVRFKATIDYPLSKVLSVLADNSRKMEWIPKLEEAKMIEEISETDVIVYYRYSTPWPFSGRDFLIKSTAEFNSQTKVLKVLMKSVPEHKNLKSNDNYVRGISHDGYTILRYKDKRTTEIEMAFLNEFGGFIPNFVINLVQKKWPYKFMGNLRRQLRKDDIIVNPQFKIK